MTDLGVTATQGYTTEAAMLAGREFESAGAQWFAVYTNVRHEKRVAQAMDERRVDCFLPLYRAARRWKDRKTEVELPLFPGYVFVHMSAEERLKVLRVPGIVHIVGVRGKPVPLPESDIRMLRERMQHKTRLEPHPYLTEGRRVHVRTGPLAGLEGILKRRKDKCRIVISIDPIMLSAAVEVDEADIEPIR